MTDWLTRSIRVWKKALPFAVIGIVWVSIGYLRSGGENVGALGITWWGTILYYLAGLVIVGFVGGLLGGFASNRIQGGLVGFVVAVLLALMINFLISPVRLGGWRLLLFLVGFGAMLGFPSGLIWWERDAE
jgi:hypothetical protein